MFRLPVLKTLIRNQGNEEDLLMNVYRNEGFFSETVSSVMVSKLETLDVQSDEAKLYETLSNGKVAIMFDQETFVGFITKVDLINRYKSAFVADQEINMVACLTQLMAECEWT